jgi:beta-glucosidase
MWAGDVGAEGRGYAADKYFHSANAGGPLFPFGAGLSYASFSLSKFSVAAVAGGWAASVKVSSAAGAAYMVGDAVVQVYVQDPIGVTGARVRPWKRLVGFGRVRVAPGEAVLAVVEVGEADLAMVDEAMTWRVVPGTYGFSVGLSSVGDGEAGIVRVVVG